MKPKYQLAIAVLLICFISCQSGFRISGTAPTDSTITFDHYVDGELQTAGISKPAKGKFRYKDRAVKNPEIYFLAVNLTDKQTIGHFFIAEKGHTQVSIDTSGVVKVWGTELNNRLQGYHNHRDSLIKPFNQLYFAHQKKRANERRLSDEEKEILEKESKLLDDYEKKIRQLDLQFTKANINNPAGRLSLNNFVLYSPTVEELKEIASAANEQALELRSVQQVVKQIEEIERSEIGRPFIDVELNLPNGKNVFIADYAGKGKPLLIYAYIPSYFTSNDFTLLNNLHNQNTDLKILSVALDGKKDKWLELLKRYDMKWVQLIDISGSMGDLATAYNINSFPYFILLDNNGTILLRSSKPDDIKKQDAF